MIIERALDIDILSSFIIPLLLSGASMQPLHILGRFTIQVDGFRI